MSRMLVPRPARGERGCSVSVGWRGVSRRAGRGGPPMQLRIACVTAVLLASAGLAHGEDGGPKTADVRKAVERALPFIEEKGVAWIKERACVTCHQTAFLIWTHNEAERRGFPVDRRKVNEWTNWALVHALTLSESQRPNAHPGDENGDDTLSQFILGRDLA